MTLDEFMKLPLSNRRQRFDELSLGDQLEFVSSTHSVELILCGYPSEEQILSSAQQAAEMHNGGIQDDDKTIH